MNNVHHLSNIQSDTCVNHHNCGDYTATSCPISFPRLDWASPVASWSQASLLRLACVVSSDHAIFLNTCNMGLAHLHVYQEVRLLFCVRIVQKS